MFYQLPLEHVGSVIPLVSQKWRRWSEEDLVGHLRQKWGEMIMGSDGEAYVGFVIRLEWSIRRIEYAASAGGNSKQIPDIVKQCNQTTNKVASGCYRPQSTVTGEEPARLTRLCPPVCAYHDRVPEAGHDHRLQFESWALTNVAGGLAAVGAALTWRAGLCV